MGTPRAGAAPAGEPEVVVVADRAALARAAAARVVDELRAAIDRRGEAHLALTGGSTALPLYEELAGNWRDALDWRRVHLWWGDERLVPVDHPASNTGLAYGALLGAGERPGLAVPAENLHPFGVDEALGESDPGPLAAERYAVEIARRVPSSSSGLPAFDVILLGVGPDGHLLSVFAGSPALAVDAPLVVAVPAPEHVEPHLPRLTLSPRLLEAARLLVVMVAGSAKAEVVAGALAAEGPPAAGGAPAADGAPAELIARLARRANALWLLDEGAAALLPPAASA